MPFRAAHKPRGLTLAAFGTLALAAALPAAANAEYRSEIRNDMADCRAGAGPALLVTVEGIKSSKGTIRVQSYRATAAEWLAKGKWLSRIEVPAHAGSMTFCVPVASAGSYGIAVRHDENNNGKTDLTEDGGAMSNNPSLNIFNLGKPSYTKVGVAVGQEARAIRIQMRYM